ncbi:agmatine deiminase family protein [Thalassoglobus sp.]|uniref:agmatine deiminase family protein n=1 Tax=Thalassoglobus sp. TaxID=2795869 RepID=UPI003AA95CA2
MPAEWEPQEAIWLSWPHSLETWPGAFEPVPHIFAEIARHIAESQLVRINVTNESMADEVRQLLNNVKANIANVRFHLNPTNDAWVRDHGPIYLVRSENQQTERAITNWGYNSWGEKYPPFDLDNAIPKRISEEFQEFAFSPGMILEGGSIDVNGSGTLLTTTSCLLNKNRNPGLSQSEIETRLKNFLGVNKILWLGEGIVGDDTDGHIDDITRFVSSNVIVTAIEENASDENYSPLQLNRELLQGMTDLEGNSFEIVSLPMPDPVYFEKERLPASYANFLICNSKVLVPTYRCKNDQTALGILGEQFPDREVVGIDCTDLVWGLGAIHCLTQQQPSADSVFPL